LVRTLLIAPLASLLALALLAGACKGNEGKPIDPAGSAVGASSHSTSSTTAPSLADPYDHAIVDLEDVRSRMCACADVQCTDKVFADFTTWRMEFRKANAGTPPTAEQDRKGNAIDHEIKACRAKVAAAVTRAGSGSVDTVEAARAELDRFKAKMCACGDKACADAVQADYANWERALRAKLVDKPEAVQELRGTSVDKEMVACRRKAEAATPGAAGSDAKIETMLEETQGFRDKLCACKTKDCATAIGKDMQAWLGRVAKDLADAKPTKAQDDRADTLQAEIKACVDKLN